MDKRLELHKLNDGFLIESKVRTISGGKSWRINKMNMNFRYVGDLKETFRPALEIDHFNDGSMVLCDGLVVEVTYADFSKSEITSTRLNKIESWNKLLTQTAFLYEGAEESFSNAESIIAVKIIGVDADHELHGKELDMKVVEL